MRICSLRFCCLRGPVLLAVLLLGVSSSTAALALYPAETFFTNIASRLLRQQLGLELTQIQIAPTNQYDSAVHRILQVTANIYDATSTNEFPSVFRPLFTTNGGKVFLAGFTNDNRMSTLAPWLDSHRVPLVIAARRGFPGFNEFTLRTDVLTQRRLELTRPSTNAPPNATNQMYTLSLSNFFGAEMWNPYAAAYPRGLNLMVWNVGSMTLSNETGTQLETEFSMSVLTNVPGNSWSGGENSGFVLPLLTNDIVLNSAPYVFATNGFGGLPATFESTPGLPIPQSILWLSNRVTCLIRDGDHVIDFVALDWITTIDLQREVWTGNPYPPGSPAVLADVWATNRSAALAPTAGMLRQLSISLGDPWSALSAAHWADYGLTSPAGKESAISSFRAFCGLPPLLGSPEPASNDALVMMTPFNPAARLAVTRTWQANDPLVRFHPRDLEFFGSSNLQFLRPRQSPSNVPPSSVGRFNDRYSPWLGNPRRVYYPQFTDRAIQDAGVLSSKQWQFPATQTLRADWLGRIHRGTPWQTIYLQADVAPMNAWLQRGNDSRSHPTNDWRLASLLAALFNTNDVRNLTSVNTTNADQWTATFAGMTVLSNNVEHPVLCEPPQFEGITVASNAPQIGTILAGVHRERGRYFTDVANFLSVPELSSASPWLNVSAFDQSQFGVTDEAYEMLPSQLLGLVRSDPVNAIAQVGNLLELRFTAFDGYAFRVENSTNLVTWSTLGEPFYSTNGLFALSIPATSGPQFFRAVLLPGN